MSRNRFLGGCLACGLFLLLASCGSEDGTSCAPGTHEEKNACLPDYAQIVCSAGTHEEGGKCLPDYAEVKCGTGTHLENGACLPDQAQIKCGPGTVEQNGACVLEKPEKECGRGTILRGQECITSSLQYVSLPFPKGKAVTVSQGNNGYFSHYGSSEYAIDFPVEEGTEIVAAREGTVWAVRGDSNSGCATEDCADQANYVIIDHGDATFGIYYHLKKDGALVTPGTKVCKGQKIALSGNTGFSSGPHLHFAVRDIYGQSLPLFFDELGDTTFGIALYNSPVTSENEAATTCEASNWSACPTDAFLDHGVLLDSSTPCSWAVKDTSYPLRGKVLGSMKNLLVSQYLRATSTWKRTCITVGADGAFDTSLAWAKTDFEPNVGSALFLTAADENCAKHEGWHTSVAIAFE